MKTWLPLTLAALLTVGCEIRLPQKTAQQPGADRPNTARTVETKTGSYETAEPMGTGAMAAHMTHMNEQMVEQLGVRDENYEKRFIDLMIPHHEGAVLMARHALEHSNQDELKQMAQKMIDDQQAEIERLKALRAEWYGKD